MPPVVGSVATGDCATMPATFTYVPKRLAGSRFGLHRSRQEGERHENFQSHGRSPRELSYCRSAVLLDVAARQKSVTRVHVTDRDLDVIIADAWFSDIARVIHLERHILEGPAVARIQPAHAAEAPTARNHRAFRPSWS